MSEVYLRPKTEEARAIVDSFGEIWTVAADVPDPVYGSQRKLMVEKSIDKGQRWSRETMWVSVPHDDMFEVIWR